MKIELNPRGDLLELMLAGVLDNETASQLTETLDEQLRQGWHRILLDLSEIRYISSAGIGALVAAHQRFQELNGLFGICHPSDFVEQTLRQTRLYELLLCEPEVARAGAQPGASTLQLQSHVASEDGLDMQVFHYPDSKGLHCQVIGEPSPLFDSQFSAADNQPVDFPDSCFGIGLGALGPDFAAAENRYGEILAVGGCVAQSTYVSHGLPDYAIARGAFTPRVQMLYGLKFTGSFSRLIRFDVAPGSQSASISSVIRQSLKQAGCERAGVVLLAESAGMVGAQLRQSPAQPAPENDRFAYPQVKRWLSYSTDRVYAHHLALITGIVGTRDSLQDPLLAPHVRPLVADQTLAGHLHAAIFPYRPLKKRTLELEKTVSELMEAGMIRDVIHLLHDSRAIFGAGESELLGGACWIAPMTAVESEVAVR